MDDIRDGFVAHVARVAGDQPYAVVGHSLGNVVTRMALPQLSGIQAMVMLAPPNRVPVMAKALAPSAVFRTITGDAGKRLQDPAFFASLPLPPPRTLIIVGTGGPRSSWLPFRGAVNDVVVARDESLIEGVATIDVPAVHTLIMHHPVVIEKTLSFLRQHASPAAQRE
jgi:pimeloyl-ACP methyl ester carboxylesterase